MVCCCISGCNNNSADNADISFHAFPKVDAVRNIWLERIGKRLFFGKNYTALKNYRVCSVHFSLDQFRTAERNSLNRGACPTILMPVDNKQMTTMKKSCAALTCFNNSVENPALTFLPFPSNFEIAKQWAIQAGRDDLTKSFTACRRNYLCSEHFESFYFEPYSKKTRFKSGFEPVPTIFESGSVNNLSTNITSFSVDEKKNNESQERQDTCDLQLDANFVDLQTVNVCVSEEFEEYNYSEDPLEEFGVNNDILKEDIWDTMVGVCRLCAEKFPITDLMSLFDTKIGNKYLNMHLMWLPVKVSRNDGLPQYICGECGMKLEQCSTILRKFIVAYNKLREMSDIEGPRNEHYSVPTVTVSKQTESINTVVNSNTDAQNVLENTNYTWNVINNEDLPELTHLKTEQIIHNTTNSDNEIENTPIRTTNISKPTKETKNTNSNLTKETKNTKSNLTKETKNTNSNLATETKNTNKIEVKQLRTYSNKSKKTNKLTPAKQITKKDQEKVDQFMYKCSECSKLLSTQEEMFAHCLSVHPVALQGTVTCTTVRVTKEIRDSVIDLTTTDKKDDAIVQINTSSLNGLLTNETVSIENDPLMEQDSAEQVTTGNTFNNAPVIVVPVQDVDLTAVDTSLTESILKNILTYVNDLPAVDNYSEDLQKIDSIVKEISPEVSKTPTTEITLTVTNTKPTEKPDPSFVLKYECSLCFKLLPTKKELINHCLTVHSLSKQDSVVCKVIKTRDKQQCSKKPGNITNMASGALPSTVSEKENISNTQTKNNTALRRCQLDNISTVAPLRNNIVSHSYKKQTTLQYRYQCPQCDKWLGGKLQLIYHCIVFHKSDKSAKITCKVEKSLVVHAGKSTQQVVNNHIQGMIIQDKQPDIELPAPDFTPIENHSLIVNIDLPSAANPKSQNTENCTQDLSNGKYRLMFECAKCERRFNTKPELVKHCYVNNCFINHQILCKEVKFRPLNREQVEKYECLRCKLVFEKKEYLIEHSSWYHPSAKPKYRVVYRSEQRRRCVMQINANKQIDSTGNYRNQVNKRHFGYKCNYCEETFARMYGFNEHLKFCVKRYIAIASSAELPDCKPMNKNKRELMPILELKHKPRRILQPGLCMYCGKVCGNLFQLKVHERIHTNEHPYKCPECPKMFRSSTTLASHKLTHSNERNYICDLCGKRYRSQNILRAHVKTHTIKPERRFVCEICNARYTTRGGLRKHKAKHTELIAAHKCTMCEKMFMTSERLEQHVHMRHNKFRFPCPDCPKVYARKCRLVEHRNTHTGEKPYLCETCGKAFSNMGARYKHRLIHLAVKRYICDVCGKRFTRNTNLNAHKLIHTRAKSFECDVCGKKFAYRYSMTHHKRTHQQVTQEPQVIVEEVLSCDPSDLLI